MRASESFRAFFACVGFWFFMAMLIFGYLARPTETTSSGLHIGASELRAAGIYSAAGIHWFEKQLSPGLHRLAPARPRARIKNAVQSKEQKKLLQQGHKIGTERSFPLRLPPQPYKAADGFK